MDIKFVLEKLLKSYLDKHDVKYTCNAKKIYLIKFKSDLKKLYKLDELKGSFDKEVSTKFNVDYFDQNHYFISNIIETNSSDFIYSNLEIPFIEKDSLVKLYDNIPVIEKNLVNYNISSVKKNGLIFMVEYNIKTIKKTTKHFGSVLSFDDQLISFNNFDELDLKHTNNEFLMKKSFSEIDDSLKLSLPIIVKNFSEIEKKHEVEMDDLIKIQTEHNQVKYDELTKKENKILFNIEENEDKSKNARDFTSMKKYDDKIKSLQKKYNTLLEKNSKLRDQIKHDFDLQQVGLRSRDISVDVKLHGLFNLDFSIFNIKFKDDNSEYIYVPFLNEFLKLN